MAERYLSFSKFVLNKYGERTYKIPINYPVTCPNRANGSGGCIFCGEEGAGFEMLSSDIRISEQFDQNSRYIGSKYKAGKYIIYFQNYTFTNQPMHDFMRAVTEAADCSENVVALYMSARPDCMPETHLDFLAGFSHNRGLDIVLETGLQSANDSTLEFLKRGHTAEDFKKAVYMAKERGIGICAHVISDIPCETIDDVIKTAEFIAETGVEQVKCHSLYVLENTALGRMYSAGEFIPLRYEEYLERTVAFIRHTPANVVFQRLVGRAPADRTLFCNWGKSWRRIKDDIDRIMESNDYYQGDYQKT